MVTQADAKSNAATAQENLAYTVGVQAYIYGQPIMDLYRTFWEGPLDPKRGHDRTLNEFNLVRKLVTPKDTWVVTPNNDTLYARGFLDLTDEPTFAALSTDGGCADKPDLEIKLTNGRF